MKKYINIKTLAAGLCLLGVAFSVGACKGFLDEKLYNRYDKSNYFTSVSNLDMAVLAIYRTMQDNGTYGQGYLGYDNDTDLTYIQGTGVNTGNLYRDLCHYYIKPSASIFDDTWRLLYAGIEKANVVLESYQTVPITSDADQKNVDKLVAEAKFLRALYHFDLLRFFGEIPLKTTASDLSQNDQLPRTPREQIYTQICQDMEEAIPALPWWDDTGMKNDCRVHKGAALGMLARVYLYRGGYSLTIDGQMTRPSNYLDYYQKVLTLTNTILTDGATHHSLNTSYERIFRNHCEFTSEPKESMFEVDMYYSATQDTKSVTGSWNVIITADGIANGAYSRANSFVRCCKFLYDKFEAADLRRDVSVGTYQVDANGNRAAIANKNSQNWSSGKWRREWQDKAIQVLNLNNTCINYVVLRYSDVLLMRAEALNETGGSSTERDELVNQVRRRGYGLPITTASAKDMPAGLSKNDFFKYLQEERAREFSFESCIRKMDLIRWNLLGAKLSEANDWAKANNTVYVSFGLLPADGDQYVSFKMFESGTHELFPIPTRELNENPALLPQNHGY